MTSFGKKKNRKIDLLEMPTTERIKLIRKVKENLRQKAVEAKLWQSFMQADNLNINGKQIQIENLPLKGLSIDDILKST
jgi:hypothetical protein